MNRCAIVVTHHKTGTAWMHSTFRDICAALEIPYMQINQKEPLRESDVKAPMVIFNSNSDFSKTPWMIENPEHRIFHVIRDPRDIAISAAHYHRVAKELWLHNPKPVFHGKTYQQKINSLPNDRQRYLFEMSHSSKHTIQNIRDWDYTRKTSFECKYEDLIQDADMSLFTEIAKHLGFSGGELKTCRKFFWKHSIFGGKSEMRATQKTIHIRSGDAQQWRGIFDRHLGKAFVQTFDKTLVELGYEPNNKWVNELPQRHAASKAPGDESNVASPAGE